MIVTDEQRCSGVRRMGSSSHDMHASRLVYDAGSARLTSRVMVHFSHLTWCIGCKPETCHQTTAVTLHMIMLVVFGRALREWLSQPNGEYSSLAATLYFGTYTKKDRHFFLFRKILEYLIFYDTEEESCPGQLRRPLQN